METKTIETQYGKRLTRGPYTSMREIERANDRAGNHWFKPDTLRFFGSRVGEDVYGGRLFVTSEKPPHGARAWSIRAALDDGTIETVGEFLGYGSRAAAHRAARALAAELPAS